MSDENQTAAEQKLDEVKTEDPSDKLTPDHPRFKEVLNRAKESEGKVAELEQKLAQLQEQIAARQERTGDDDFTEEELKALARIEKGLASRGFVRKDDLQSESFQIKLERQFERLNEKYDGTNGLPKFVADEVYAYAKKKGMTDDLESAYKLLNLDTIVEVEAKKRSNGLKPPTSERPTSGDRQGANLEVSPTDIAEMSDEDWEKKRIQILQSLKGR